MGNDSLITIMMPYIHQRINYKMDMPIILKNYLAIFAEQDTIHHFGNQDYEGFLKTIL